MYEGDSWYNAFVPRTTKAADKPDTPDKLDTPGKPQQRARESLLRQPNVSHRRTPWVR
jgi:hypothetical protein